MCYNCNNWTVHSNCNTPILLRIELWSPSYSFFWNFTKYLRKVFETSLNDLYLANRTLKLTHFISKVAENNNCCVKHAFWKVFRKLYKTIMEFISSNFADLFYLKSTQRGLGHWKGTRWSLKGHLRTRSALKGHSKGTRALKALRHSNTWGTWTLKGHLRSWALKALATWALEYMSTWDTRAHEGHLGTRVLKVIGHSGTLFRRHFSELLFLKHLWKGTIIFEIILNRLFIMRVPKWSLLF